MVSDHAQSYLILGEARIPIDISGLHGGVARAAEGWYPFGTY